MNKTEFRIATRDLLASDVDGCSPEEKIAIIRQCLMDSPQSSGADRRRVRFSIRTLLLSFVVFAFIFWFVKPYFFPPHLAIEIMETGGFQINGSDVDRADIRHRFVRFVDEMHSKHYRAKLKIVFPFDGTNGTDDETFQYVCREARAAGFDQDELVPANNAWYRSKTRRNN